MASSGARLPKMAERRIFIATAPGIATPLHRQDTGDGDARYLANLAYCHIRQ